MKRLSGRNSRAVTRRALNLEFLERREVFAVGGLDPTFNFGFGKANTDFGGTMESIYDTAFQSDGRIIAIGSTSAGGSDYNFGLVRYLSDGTLDPSFGGFGGLANGLVATDFNQGSDHGQLVLVQPDGKILAIGNSYHSPDANGGQSSLVISRYLSDGSIDESFGTLGKVIVLNPDLNASQSVVSAFIVDGRLQLFSEYYYDSGFQTRIVSIDLANGSLDVNFGNNGQLILDLPLRVEDVAQAGNQYILVGSTLDEEAHPDGSIAVVRINANGTLDMSFGNAGVATPTNNWPSSSARSVAVQGDGKIVVGGDGYLSGDKVVVIIRLLDNGTLDATFNIDGMYEQSLHVGWIEEIALGPNGSIVAVGTSRPENQTGDFAVLKVAADGAPDANFGDNGMVTVNFSGHQDIARSLLLYANGKILVAGSAGMGTHNDFALTRIIGQSPAIGAPGRFGRPTDVMFVNPSTTPNPRENLLSPSGQLRTAPQPLGAAQVHKVASGSVKSPAPGVANSNRNASVRDSLFALFGEDEHEALIAAHWR